MAEKASANLSKTEFIFYLPNSSSLFSLLSDIERNLFDHLEIIFSRVIKISLYVSRKDFSGKPEFLKKCFLCSLSDNKKKTFDLLVGFQMWSLSVHLNFLKKEFFGKVLCFPPFPDIGIKILSLEDRFFSRFVKTILRVWRIFRWKKFFLKIFFLFFNVLSEGWARDFQLFIGNFLAGLCELNSISP